MAFIIDEIGSLRELLYELNRRKIYEFRTLEDITTFRNGYKKYLKKIAIPSLRGAQADGHR